MKDADRDDVLAAWQAPWVQFLDLETSTEADAEERRLLEACRCAQALALAPRLASSSAAALEQLHAYLRGRLVAPRPSPLSFELAVAIASVYLAHGPWEAAIPLVGVAEAGLKGAAALADVDAALRRRLASVAGASIDWERQGGTPLHFATAETLDPRLVDEWSAGLRQAVATADVTPFAQLHRPGAIYGTPSLRFRLAAYFVFFGKPELVLKVVGPEQLRRSHQLRLGDLNAAGHELFLLCRKIVDLVGESEPAVVALQVGELLAGARSNLGLEGELLAVGCALQIAGVTGQGGLEATARGEWRSLSLRLSQGASEDLWGVAAGLSAAGLDQERLAATRRSFKGTVSRAALSVAAWKVREFFSSQATQAARQQRMFAEIAGIFREHLPISTFLLQKLEQLGMKPDVLMTPEIAGQFALQPQRHNPHLGSPVRQRLHEILAEELGAEQADTFASISSLPLGVGSVGTVHAAKGRDGTDLAVKVRHDGVKAAIRRDAQKVEGVRWLLELVAPKLPWKQILATWKDLLLAECDYLVEAANHQAVYAAVAAAAVPNVRVPRLFPELSTDKIMVMELVEGLRFDEFLAASTQRQRNQAALAIVEYELVLWSRGLYVYDIHPGNFLFTMKPTPDGGEAEVTVWPLDFGAGIQDPDEISFAFTTFIYYMSKPYCDEAVSCLKISGFYRDNADWQAIWQRYRDLYLLPFLQPGEFEINLEFARKVIAEQLTTEYGRPEFAFPGDGRSTVMRVYWSLYSLIGRMNATADWSSLAQRYARPFAPAALSEMYRRAGKG